MPLSRAEVHLARLKQGLLLYVDAKYLYNVKLVTLEPQLMSIGVSKRSVNGVWSLVRAAIQGIGTIENAEAAAVAKAMINDLTYVPKPEHSDALRASNACAI